MTIGGMLSHVRRPIGPLAAVPALLFLWAVQAASAETPAPPIRLHPENPHYFLWRGKPTVLVASTEHYGAVLNADFDYRRYLDELKARGLNYTRLFSGVYCEPWGEPFNTLNPPKGRYLTPWARSDQPGYADGGNKFDLSHWDEAYFSRLRDFLSEAGKRGIVAELTLFCNWYDDNQWRLSSPQKRENGRAPAVAASQANRAGSALRVSESGRYLVRPDGKPFFWLGDTAWLLSQMTRREDVELYLKTRAQQGFTVIQAAVVMGEERVGGTLRPNLYSDLAFSNGDPTSPLITSGNDPAQAQQYDYWDHVDYIVERAAAHGLTLGLLPLFVGWGGDGYKYLTPDRAYGYGLFLGERYRDQPHILWILGGDNTPDTEAKQRVWHEVACGITVGVAGTEDYNRTLMTYHINGGNSSSQWFHKAPWLDFNMIQVWGDEKGIYPKIMQDYRLTPAKPTGLGEGSYEDGPQYPTRPIDALKIRKQAYWSCLAGGYHTYGNTDTWNFSSYKPEGTRDWKTSLQSTGAAHLSVLSRVFTSLEWWKLVPDPALFAEGSGSGETLNVAMRSTAGDRLLVYLSAPATFSLHRDALSAVKTAQAVWIDPRTGARSPGEELPASGTRSFSTPKDWPDALLLVEAQSGSR